MHDIYRKHIFLSVIVFLSLICLTIPAYTAVVVLKTGERINGLILNKTDDVVEISIQGKPTVYMMQDIKEIRGKQILPQKSMKKEIEKEVASDFGKALSRAAGGKFEEAAQMFKKIAEDNPSYTNAKEALALSNDAAFGKVSRDYALYVFEASQQMLKENYALAIALFQKALKRNPKAIELYYNLGCAHQFLGEHAKALPYFEKLNKINPDDQEVLFKLGVTLHALGRYAKALPYFENLEKLTPDDPQVFAFLGTSYQALGQVERGNEYLRKAKALFEVRGETLNAQEMEAMLEN